MCVRFLHAVDKLLRAFSKIVPSIAKAFEICSSQYEFIAEAVHSCFDNRVDNIIGLEYSRATRRRFRRIFWKTYSSTPRDVPTQRGAERQRSGRGTHRPELRGGYDRHRVRTAEPRRPGVCRGRLVLAIEYEHCSESASPAHRLLFFHGDSM